MISSQVSTSDFLLSDQPSNLCLNKKKKTVWFVICDDVNL